MPEYTPPTPEEAVRGVELPPHELSQIEHLLKVMVRLRRDDGCPWDRAQTHESLLQNLLEESYEYLEAVRSGDRELIKEELGDLFLQVIFHGQIAAEAGDFTLGDASEYLTTKLLRRHPHVFGDQLATDSTEALASWNAAKRTEGEHTVDLEAIPKALPALIRAKKVQEKAAKVGFEWPDAAGAMLKVVEELEELRQLIDPAESESIEPKRVSDELGDLLFAVVNVARYLHTDPEVALIGTIEKFIRRFKYIERRLAETGLTLGEASLEVMDGYWDEAKGRENL